MRYVHDQRMACTRVPQLRATHGGEIVCVRKAQGAQARGELVGNDLGRLAHTVYQS